MSDKTKAETTATPDKADKPKSEKLQKGMIDPRATSPSNDPNRDERAATATEPNSKQRVAEKRTSRTGRGNGGGNEDAAKIGLRGGVGRDLTPDTLGEREGVSPAETDLIWTNASKDKWGVDQPSMSDQLKQRDAIRKQREERDSK